MIFHNKSLLSFFLMAVLVVSAIGFSVSSYAGLDSDAFETDSGSYQISGPYDLRNRNTLLQISNVATTPVTIHVQIFDAVDGCRDNDFFDTFTPQDTHVYDISNLTTNVGTDGIGGFSTLPPVIPASSYGFVVISEVDTNNQNEHQDVNSGLIGNVRIQSGEGYEYRTNLADVSGEISNIQVDDEYTFNFNSFGTPTFSDVIGYVLSNTGTSESSVTASPASGNGYIADIIRYDLNEGRLSCGSVSFTCIDNVAQDFSSIQDDELANQDVIGLNLGISNVLPNSRGAEALCPNDNPASTAGHILIEAGDDCNANDEECGFPDDQDSDEDIFVGFIGLNDGGDRGSFDSFWFPGDEDPEDTAPIPTP